MRCLFFHQLNINSLGLTLSRNRVHLGARFASSRDSPSLRCAAELAGVKINVVFRMKCMLDDTSVADT